MENLQADSFARDYHITAELAAQRRTARSRRYGLKRSLITATPMRRPIPPSFPLVCFTSAPAPMTSRRLMSRWMVSIRISHQAASPIAVPSG